MRKKEPVKQLTFDSFNKVPPQCIDIEENVLGNIINDSELFYKVNTILKEEMFYKEVNMNVFKAIKHLIDTEVPLDMLTLQSYYNNLSNDLLTNKLYIYNLSSKGIQQHNIVYHALIIKEKFISREIIRICQEAIEKVFNGEDVLSVINFINNSLELYSQDLSNKHESFIDSIKNTISDLKSKKSGDKVSFYKTGDTKFDKILALRGPSILVVAADKGCAKSSYITYIVRKVIENNVDSATLWYTMEDSTQDIVMKMISNYSGLSPRQQQSIDYTITEEDEDKIDNATNKILGFNIKFVDRKSRISNIKTQSRLFAKQYPDKFKIIIIDNLGLVGLDDGIIMTETQKDDYIAGQFVKIREQTGALIIIIHHLSKAQMAKANIIEGYRPREEYVRGSSRILDYANQVVLVNLPRKYPDLLREEKSKFKKLTKQINNIYDLDSFKKDFFSLNPNGDKETEKDKIEDLVDSTFIALNFHIRERKDNEGNKLTYKYLYAKYVQYNNFIDNLNKSREDKYKKGKQAIYTWLYAAGYNQSYIPSKDTRDYYLYGESTDNSGVIDNLFIAEVTKNRDASFEDNLIRYIVNLDNNKFELWKE